MDISTQLLLNERLEQMSTSEKAGSVIPVEKSSLSELANDIPHTGDLLRVMYFDGSHQQLVVDPSHPEWPYTRAEMTHAGCLVFCKRDGSIARRTSVEVSPDVDPNDYWDFYCAPNDEADIEWHTFEYND